MLHWRERGRGSSGGESSSDSDVSLPLGPGEWDSALGLPLCVVCQNVSTCPFGKDQFLTGAQSDQMEVLERERGWKEDEFDFVLQSLRTVLLKRTFLAHCTILHTPHLLTLH